MGDRVILHSDINCCYASIEHLHHPELAGKPLAVGGDPEARHGIVLTADYIAKKYGVKTGMALWQAKQVCPDITFVSPRMDLYLRFSRMAHEIYAEYTDKQEPYGIDECWLDVTGSSSLKGDGLLIAQEISRRMKSELGITVSVGVSFNKIFAKLGSDYKKSDFRAVKVKECVAVPKSKKLLQFTLDDGTGTDRTILSGIHAYYEPEELVGKTLIAITNLPPRKMMGIESCGMLLSAVNNLKDSEDEELHLLMVDDHIPAGAKLY